MNVGAFDGHMGPHNSVAEVQLGCGDGVPGARIDLVTLASFVKSLGHAANLGFAPAGSPDRHSWPPASLESAQTVRQ